MILSSDKIQVKATDNLPLLKDGQTIAFPIARSDLEYWLAELMPVILIVFDAQADIAYWLYVQAYVQERSDALTILGGDSITVHLSKAHVVDMESARRFARFKADVIRQRTEVIYYVL
jgi:hypothetical protein